MINIISTNNNINVTVFENKNNINFGHYKTQQL